ncbi:FadR/GntR family transcriptional regulator [Wenjunlia vitaminophila]|uniref:FadR/GntR family transcriptional regulator n=1 Tax=Wenjunlia vitaminophila TaxID=76728 RepID=UPI00036494EE|nr:FCD domain-containing protein [Wenjunlia vitaminophila]
MNRAADGAGPSGGIQGRIKRLIIDENLEPGAPLPTEVELVQRLGVSRNSVREALKALQAVGIVEVRHGFGTFVGSMSLEPFVEALTFRTVLGQRQGRQSLLELLELREAVEAGLVRRVVGRIPEDDLTRLRHLVGVMRQDAESPEGHARTDREFHVTLYQALDNPLLSEVLDAFWDALHQVSGDLAQPHRPSETWREHQEILKAVRAGDASRAEDAVRRHFDDIRARLTRTAAAG